MLDDLTEDDIAAFIKLFRRLPPSGTDVSEFTETQKANVRKLIDKMQDGTPGAGKKLKQFFT